MTKSCLSVSSFLNISYLKTDECFYELLLCSTLSRLLVHEKLFHAKQKKRLQRPFTPKNPVPLPLPWFSLNLNRIRKYRSLFYTHRKFTGTSQTGMILHYIRNVSIFPLWHYFAKTDGWLSTKNATNAEISIKVQKMKWENVIMS